MKTHLSRQRERGSLLIVALILSAIIGISLASYIQLGLSSLTISNRALYNNAAMNLAENGLEEAMYSINKKVADSTYAWPGWSNDGTNAWIQLPTSGTYNFDQNTTGTVRVYVSNYLGTTPSAVARARVTLGGTSGRTIDKWVQIQLRKTSKFANGLVAKQSVTFKGNGASVDSWNSEKNPDGTLRTPPVAYAAGYRNDNGTVGSISVSVDAILIQNADIWGYAATGGVAPTVGPNGLVGPFGTAAGTTNPGHVSTDFTANFDPITNFPPSGTNIAGGITDTLNLPRSGDPTVMVDGVLTYCYTTSEISFNNKALNIQKLVSTDPSPNVIITLTNTTSSINIGGGSGALNIETGATLQIYAPGDIEITGNGILNGGSTAATANQPISLQIWGTKTSGVQDIDIGGNGVMSGIIYAPQGTVKINGNGDVCGSVVANDITLNGSNAAFHYDESLADFGGDNPFRVSVWKELTSATDRNTHASAINW
ncbi:MAG: DUF7305 domain-containing protein [Opitutaceae bacterium]